MRNLIFLLLVLVSCTKADKIEPYVEEKDYSEIGTWYMETTSSKNYLYVDSNTITEKRIYFISKDTVYNIQNYIWVKKDHIYITPQKDTVYFKADSLTLKYGTVWKKL